MLGSPLLGSSSWSARYLHRALCTRYQAKRIAPSSTGMFSQPAHEQPSICPRGANYDFPVSIRPARLFPPRLALAALVVVFPSRESRYFYRRRLRLASRKPYLPTRASMEYTSSTCSIEIFPRASFHVAAANTRGDLLFNACFCKLAREPDKKKEKNSSFPSAIDQNFLRINRSAIGSLERVIRADGRLYRGLKFIAVDRRRVCHRQKCTGSDAIYIACIRIKIDKQSTIFSYLSRRYSTSSWPCRCSAATSSFYDFLVRTEC